MSSNNQLSRFSRSLLLTVGMFLVFVLAFVIYVRAERQIDRANETRYQSYVLADELRQSSDDLTRMVRTYVATGDTIYKKRYQEILDIRDGNKPRPVKYEDIYWDLVLADDQRPRPDGQAVALLEQMRQAGFTAAEFAKVAQAKANSDTLTKTEFVAMVLIESTVPITEANRLKATRMLNDASYHQAKAGIMRPISEFYQMMEQRTLKAVRDAESVATLVRVILIALGLLLAFSLWNAYRALHATLGCSVDELQERIARLGSGDFSSPVPVPRHMENSVLAWVSETQISLARINAERKQAEAALFQLNAELEQRVAQRTAELETALYDLENFNYSASHDLRIPLRAIDGFARILLDEYSQKLDDEGKRLLNVVRDNSRKMAQFIDDMLAFSRTGRMAMTLAEINMDDLVHEVAEELKSAAAGHEFNLEINKLPPAFADRPMLRQLFFNLLSNAIKFSRPKDAPRIEVGASIQGDETIFYVKDNGVGFDMQYAGKLFGVFQRLHSVTEFEGTGIGLAIVKRIITRHGGRVWAEGKVNEGATVYFALPTKEAAHG
jgi:signal transduction histidine kinase